MAPFATQGRLEGETFLSADVIAEALSDLMLSRAQDDPELTGAAQKLRDAIGLEDRH